MRQVVSSERRSVRFGCTTTQRSTTTGVVAAWPGIGVGVVLCAVVFGLPGCNSVERAPDLQPTRVNVPERNVSTMMRGTVASETIMLGYEPVVVRGFGLVVGLNGTGSRDVEPALRAHMIATAARHGIGQARYGSEELSPEALLNSMDTAVVIVEAVIPPAATEGSRFDVRVFAEPRSGTTSLEGGRLYTTELRPGELSTGRGQAFPLAEARGDLFLNPFMAGESDDGTDFTQLTGRILNGGETLKDIPLRLQLIDPSHRMAQSIQNAINARFPQDPGQRDQTARGLSDDLLELNVPPSYRDRTTEFIQLVQHTTISFSQVEATANQIKRALLETPAQWEAAAWRWQSLGPRAIPIIRDMYDHPEELPRLSALRAGAKLGDATVGPHLIDMARDAERSTLDTRLASIELLAGMPMDPRINVALRDMVNVDDVDIRLAAYEALLKRGDAFVTRRAIDDKFVVDVVDSDYPMVYITQIGEPRITVFGRDLSLRMPASASAWSNRFLLRSEPDAEEIEVYYRAPGADRGEISLVEPTLDSFIAFLGHTTSVDAPQPGLGFSYAQTVGLLHQLVNQRAVDADFKADQDRILAAILRQEQTQTPTERPEFSDDGGQNADDDVFINPDDRTESSGLVDPFAAPSTSDDRR